MAIHPSRNNPEELAMVGKKKGLTMREISVLRGTGAAIGNYVNPEERELYDAVDEAIKRFGTPKEQ